MRVVQLIAPKMVSMVAVTALLSACGSSDTGKSSVELLDSKTTHYGHTYEDLAQAWIGYLFSYAPPDCLDPLLDTTGENCTRNQEGDVFFLVGASAGVVKRTKCEVPGDKPLFFPIINVYGDNAGIPQNKLLSDAEQKSSADAVFKNFVRSSIHLSVDGENVEGLDAGVIQAKYVIHFPDGPNAYTCQKQDGVAGDFDGYAAGYYAFLPPLGPGAHSLKFGGTAKDDGNGAAVIDVSYEFTSK